MGDSNARLGSFSFDTDIHGRFISNDNKSLFLGFLKYSGAKYVNGHFARGVPTYEIPGKKKSIIDVCLTNVIHLIRSFSVLPNILGVSPQTCHKVLKTVISQSFRKDKNLKWAKFKLFDFARMKILKKLEILSPVTSET